MFGGERCIDGARPYSLLSRQQGRAVVVHATAVGVAAEESERPMPLASSTTISIRATCKKPAFLKFSSRYTYTYIELLCILIYNYYV